MALPYMNIQSIAWMNVGYAMTRRAVQNDYDQIVYRLGDNNLTGHNQIGGERYLCHVLVYALVCLRDRVQP